MEMINVRDLPAEELEARIMKGLVKDAIYAIKSNSGALVHKCYGKAEMAYVLGAIKWESFRKLNRALVNGWMNAGPEQREAYARTVTAEDINAGRNWRDK